MMRCRRLMLHYDEVSSNIMMRCPRLMPHYNEVSSINYKLLLYVVASITLVYGFQIIRYLV